MPKFYEFVPTPEDAAALQAEADRVNNERRQKNDYHPYYHRHPVLEVGDLVEISKPFTWESPPPEGKVRVIKIDSGLSDRPLIDRRSLKAIKKGSVSYTVEYRGPDAVGAIRTSFPSLRTAAKYIKDRWQGADYIDGEDGFHTDYARYDLKGFTLKDIGKLGVKVEDGYPYRTFEFYDFDADGKPITPITVKPESDDSGYEYGKDENWND